MDVSIIIVNYNTCKITLDCINSIYEKTKDISFEVILVDNASSDDSKEIFSKDNRITYIYMKFLFRNTQIRSRTFHVSHNAIRISQTFHQKFSRAQQ